MSTFLLELAEHLRNSYKNDLSKLVVMFPSLRARAFFNDALSSVSQNTIWQPHYTSIDEVMERASGLKRVDRLDYLASYTMSTRRGFQMRHSTTSITGVVYSSPTST